MKKSVKLKLSAIFSVILIVAVFILLSYLVQTNYSFFEGMIASNFSGMIIYIFLTIIGVVFAPVTVLPLIVVATSLWGWVLAAIITVFGWSTGSVIAFLIARKFGVPLIKRFMSLEKIYELEEKTLIGNNFLSVLFLRMIIPVDVLSYALGLFSKIKLAPYAIATVIGVAPFAFIFAYLGMVPFVYQIILGLLILIIFLLWLIIREIITSVN